MSACQGKCNRTGCDGPPKCRRAVVAPPTVPALALARRPTAAGRPPTYLGDVTVTALTVQDRDRPEAIVLAAGADGTLTFTLRDGHDRAVAEVSSNPDGDVGIAFGQPDGRSRVRIAIGLDGEPRVQAIDADGVGRVASLVSLMRLLDAGQGGSA